MHATQWTFLVQSIDIMEFFLKRYGDEDATIADRRARMMECVGKVRQHIQRQELKKAIKDVAAQDSEKTLVSKSDTKNGKPMQYLEVLCVLGDMPDYLVNTVSEMDYPQLV
ncbi:Fc.00g032250.m01.CDS01 [Cosmosporella sp. VM-42]